MNEIELYIYCESLHEAVLRCEEVFKNHKTIKELYVDWIPTVMGGKNTFLHGIIKVGRDLMITKTNLKSKLEIYASSDIVSTSIFSSCINI